MPVRTIAVTLFLLFAIAFAGLFAGAISTPMYGARAGRTCDNCHVTPNKWVNPDLAMRKCTLSCQGCHVDPTGGGMRTASGRFYGGATLPMIATSPRPTRDWDRNLPFVGRRDKNTSYNDNIPHGPATLRESYAYRDSVDDFWGRGFPAGESGQYAFFQGRYGNLNATPFFRFGWDIRLAALLSGTGLVFPMQADFPILLHPVQHFSFLLNTGFRGRTSGFGDPTDAERQPYFREAFLMVHEAPYQAYVKAGRFVPGYGLRLDDHTSSIRRRFELDGALPESRVSGVEIGAAPNYPFVNFSVFGAYSRFEEPDRYNIFGSTTGWGSALNLGLRDLGWSLGGSAMMKRRELQDGGDMSAVGVYGVLNPWFYNSKVPITLQGEIDYGTYQRLSGNEATQLVTFSEIHWLAANGLNFLAAHDWQDPDRDVKDDEWHRLQGGLQIIPYPGITLDGRIRTLIPSDGDPDSDLFIQLHLWN